VGTSYFLNQKLFKPFLTTIAHPTKKQALSVVLTMVAMISAKWANFLSIRKKELKEGINVYDTEGLLLGKSKVAASNAIRDGLIVRACLRTSSFTVPLLYMWMR